ncbi:MAG: transposase family protein [Janthinobacterium lividum]
MLPFQEVLLTLVYLRHNVSHAAVGAMFGVSADISERTFAEVDLLLRDLCPAHRWDAQKKWTKKEPSWSPDTLEVLLVDSFETPIAHPSLRRCRRSSTRAKRSAIRSP